MPFPPSERVIYKNNPLNQVICQLRFPTILRIESEIPVAFQERIRKEYPILQERKEIPIAFPADIAQQIPSEILDSIRLNDRAYNFVSSDEKWVVALTKNFIALTSHEYKRWEQFRDHLEEPLSTLVEEYVPSYFSRIGLRYQNIIKKTDLGLENVDWSELLNQYLTGELASPDLKGMIQDVTKIILVRLGDGHDSKVRIRQGLVKDNSGQTMGYLIDSDFFTEQNTEVNDAIEILSDFNRRNGHLFRWCITERLHEAMGPTSI